MLPEELGEVLHFNKKIEHLKIHERPDLCYVEYFNQAVLES